MTIPTDLPPGEPEKVDNTNALHRALVERLISETGTDVSTVVEQMAADGRLSAETVDAAVEKGWISQHRADDAVKAFDDLKPLPVEITPGRVVPVEPLAEVQRR